jgi:hypothetical protein
MDEKFTISCIIYNKTCDLKIAFKKRSNTTSYYLYKDGRWIAILSCLAANTYKVVSYLKPVCQLEIDAIGKQIEQILSGVKTVA